MKKLKTPMRDRVLSLEQIKGALGFENLGCERNTDRQSIETIPFDKGMVQRWLRNQSRMVTDDLRSLGMVQGEIVDPEPSGKASRWF